ncbi:hypothetical protein QBC35DRAFT_141614 [Podospora australis]|uniref:Uncharacterized protein n=1 Tax=Podospora australis TaxID=1536484 RepID=A0AAN6WWG1_9PEZI|nr:hypothetical protein QBC35DRAFT_141614 [Podospora australis]
MLSLCDIQLLTATSITEMGGSRTLEINHTGTSVAGSFNSPASGSHDQVAINREIASADCILEEGCVIMGNRLDRIRLFFTLAISSAVWSPNIMEDTQYWTFAASWWSGLSCFTYFVHMVYTMGLIRSALKVRNAQNNATEAENQEHEEV